jgi:hypothetical protein
MLNLLFSWLLLLLNAFDFEAGSILRPLVKGVN